MSFAKVVRSPWMGVAGLCVGLIGVAMALAGNGALERRTAPTSVGVVDLQRLIAGLKQVEDTNADVKRIAETYQARVNDLRTQIEKGEAEIRAMAENDPKRIERRLAVEEMKLLMEARFKGSQAIINLELGKHLRPLYTKVLESCGRLAQQQGLDLVLVDDRSLTIPDVENITDAQVKSIIENKQVLFASSTVDVTDALITFMNNEWQSGARKR
ncbi:MAG: OmpH family outer membrane protein [Phycisphaeraceae bacterium]|nr:MAG: OmpH family outer membrane protein [Phycisphaeraceae bacterium]